MLCVVSLSPFFLFFFFSFPKFVNGIFIIAIFTIIKSVYTRLLDIDKLYYYFKVTFSRNW